MDAKSVKTAAVKSISQATKQHQASKLAQSGFIKRQKDQFESEDSDTSATEEFAMEEDGSESLDEFDEQIFREECRNWLALNGKALFALETSRYLVKQSKQHGVKPVLARSGKHVDPLSIRDASH